MSIRKINYTVIAPEVEQEIKDKYTKQEINIALSSKVDNSRVLTDVPSNAKFTDTTYSEVSTTEIDVGTSSTLRAITGRRIKYILDKVQGWISALTKADIGLSNVDNTSDLDKPISTATQTALNNKVDNSRVLTDVPSNAKFTDTVYTHPTGSGYKHIPSGGADGQFLKWQSDGVAVWSIVPGGVTLGETSTTAYRGDRGKIAYDHSQSSHAPVDAISKTNTTEYTPTDDYQPATKKYVDDNSGFIIP